MQKYCTTCKRQAGRSNDNNCPWKILQDLQGVKQNVTATARAKYCTTCKRQAGRNSNHCPCKILHDLQATSRAQQQPLPVQNIARLASGKQSATITTRAKYRTIYKAASRRQQQPLPVQNIARHTKRQAERNHNLYPCKILHDLQSGKQSETTTTTRAKYCTTCKAASRTQQQPLPVQNIARPARRQAAHNHNHHPCKILHDLRSDKQNVTATTRAKYCTTRKATSRVQPQPPPVQNIARPASDKQA